MCAIVIISMLGSCALRLDESLNRGKTDAQSSLRAAIFTGDGAFADGIASVSRIVEQMNSVQLSAVSPTEIRAGALGGFDVVIFTGGSGGRQGAALGESGRAAVERFVRGGGGYVGICAGAYLATCRFDTYLKLVKAYHHRDWQSGIGDVDITWTNAGRELFAPSSETFTTTFAHGPLLVHEDGLVPPLDLPEYTVLAEFATGVGDEATRNRMVGSPAIVAAEYHEGRVLLISPHLKREAN